MLSTRALTMRFKRCNALLGVDLDIQPGTVFALLGENGAGKTTLIRILTGYQEPTSGSARVCGMDPRVDRLSVRQSIGYVSDAPALYDWMRVDEIGAFAASFYPPGFQDAYLASVQRYGLPLDRKIKHLSKGQRAKVALSLSVAHDPMLLILDEPTSGLDPVVRREFLESMIDRVATGRTVFLSSHQIGEVERVADRVAILHQGKLKLDGPLAEIKQAITQITTDVDDPLTSLPMPRDAGEILAEQTSGRQRRVILRNPDPAYCAALQEHDNVQSLAVRTLSLEEIFVVCTRGMPADGFAGSTALQAEQSRSPAGAEAPPHEETDRALETDHALTEGN
ncbi:MAG: ABC transporter ATP-binding protein [Planctomycetota bacterium]